MGKKLAKPSQANNYTDTITNNEVFTLFSPPPSQPITKTSFTSGRKSKSRICRHFKTFIRCFTFTHLSRHIKLRKHIKVRKTRKICIKRSSSHHVGNAIDTEIPFPCVPSAVDQIQMQPHWLRSKNSLLSYALSKLAFFSHLSKEKLKENATTNGNDPNPFIRQTKFCYKNAPRVNVTSSAVDKEAIICTTETGKQISWYDINNNRELRDKFLEKILSSPKVISVNDEYNFLRRTRSPEDIYRRNLKRFEHLVAITASASSSCTSHDSIKIAANKVTIDANNNVDSSVDGCKMDENGNLTTSQQQKKVKVITVESKESLQSILKLPPKRIIATSRNPVEVDTYFFDWVKKRIFSRPDTEDQPQSTVVQTVKTTTSSSTTSSESKPDGNNNNPPAKNGPFKFLRKGGGGRASTAGGMNRRAGGSKKRRNTKDTSSTTLSSIKRCEKCGPCAGKGALAGAPPAYLDYGEGEQVNSAGQAWKGKRKGDPVMDRLKNVDVVEEMTYLVPNPDCGGGGDGCQKDENEEDDCDYYAVCESCGEMEPIPDELKKELQAKRRKKRGKNNESTPVTYSRRQRFNFKNKGDMCDEDEDGPPYSYEGLQCPGCRCSCCVAGLRRNPDCGCKCCQTMGPARKCNSFDEMPVGKNPQIRRILCPEEECARRREVCTQMMPDTSGLYKFDKDNEMFERQVPRTPTPIILEVEVPAPLNKEQLLAIAREIQEKKRRGIPLGRDACCPPVEQDPVYLPPIYGQCNPPQCQPCQPCCVPNYCCGQQKPGEEMKKGESFTGSSYGYSTYNSAYETTKNGNTAKTNDATGSKDMNSNDADTNTNDTDQNNNVNNKNDARPKPNVGSNNTSTVSESLPSL